jgi:hypothetical protein
VRFEPIIRPDGSVQGPGGGVFRQTPRKLKRRECDELVRNGTPIMTDVYPSGLEWWDRADAQSRWDQISPLLVTRRHATVHEGWIAHLWETDVGEPVISLEGWH